MRIRSVILLILLFLLPSHHSRSSGDNADSAGNKPNHLPIRRHAIPMGIRC
jgi:hypothetical protein